MALISIGSDALDPKLDCSTKTTTLHYALVNVAVNDRGSIFRLIVGTALIARHHLNVPTWDDRKSSAPADVRAAELALEREVSKTIGAMPFLWVGIDDEPGDQSARGYIERNAIALLSNFGKEALDPPSSAWLGRYCNRERIRKDRN